MILLGVITWCWRGGAPPPLVSHQPRAVSARAPHARAADAPPAHAASAAARAAPPGDAAFSPAPPAPVNQRKQHIHVVTFRTYSTCTSTATPQRHKYA